MERHIVIALGLVAIVIPSMVLSAPAILDQLMDIDGANQYAAAAHDVERREAETREGAAAFGALASQSRERRSSNMNKCMVNCWLCVQTMYRNTIKMGDCIAGCLGNTKMLTNPLDAQSWSRCKSNYVQS